MLNLLPCPIPKCRHNVKDKNNLKTNLKKRPADQLNRPIKMTTSDKKNPNTKSNEFKFPRKAARVVIDPDTNAQSIETKNSFAALTPRAKMSIPQY
ncbi:hypothetical protein TNCT_332241 [Trichonephila clavata]|uniref:Uncharacterized protein n=1 Tax=Trichonephila clavata TaxID=2740835 RepID=A0A8X6HQS8_TRICU|nr:hypothetical protein TNCT_332241 [Trichonephila clavata]